MAFYRAPQSPREEQYTNPLSPPQRNPNRWSASMAATSDVRASLHRRFTTNTVPTLSPIGQQRRQAAGDVQQTLPTHNRITPSERAARHYENLLQAQRKIQEELEKVDAETRREVDENIRHEQAVTQLFAQSEPTTPPEYHNGFANNFSRPNRYSTASLTSPPGVANRSNRASTHLTSPSGAFARTYNVNHNNSNLPSQSVPGSRRQSDGEEDDEEIIYGYDHGIRRAAANPNRNSMPITSYDRKRNTTDLVLGPVNTTGFLFDDDEKTPGLPPKANNTSSPPDTKTYLQVQHTADGFPKLIRREENGDLSVSTSSAALDLASSSDHEPQQVADRASATRHRISLPPSTIGSNMNIAPLNGILANANEGRSAANNRRSMEVHFSPETKRPALLASPPRGLANGSLMPQSSYSTNDLPTLKSIGDNTSEGGVPLSSPSVQLSNLSSAPSQDPTALSRLSSGSNHQSQDRSPSDQPDKLEDAFNQTQTALQANAPSFGPGAQVNHGQGFVGANMSPFHHPSAYYTGYGPMQVMANGFAQMNLAGNGYGGHGQWPNQAPFPPSTVGPFQHFAHGGQAGPGASRPDNTQRGPTASQRRQAAEEAQAKFNSIKVEQLVGEIYPLCKDQHGCRFLQRKLEERNDKTVEVIFDEVKTHMIELMIDPFGNYLCQKLLEMANNDQRTILIRNAQPEMKQIAVNQHGTRALQKMIECVNTPEQVDMLIDALRNDVVMLIQDLNGNHVIQKCLNHLSSTDATFIFEAVGAHCVAVGTHRHGCCVLQRCIDHADGLQKGRMVDHVVRNAYQLVIDPFGNYVVQYILDLSEPCFTEPLCRAFLGQIPELSKQKFSSNVIEKCIRCSSGPTKRQIVQEIMIPHNLEKLVRDSFANYVVQTAMDFADPDLKVALVDNVRVLIPTMRNTPHGRRIQSKINDYDNRSNNPISALLTPIESASGTASAPYSAPQQVQPVQPAQQVQQAPGARANRQGMVGPPANWPAQVTALGHANFDGTNFPNGFGGDHIAAPIPQRGNQTFGIFNGTQGYQNGYGGPGFAGPGHQPYGHF